MFDYNLNIEQAENNPLNPEVLSEIKLHIEEMKDEPSVLNNYNHLKLDPVPDEWLPLPTVQQVQNMFLSQNDDTSLEQTGGAIIPYDGNLKGIRQVLRTNPNITALILEDDNGANNVGYINSGMYDINEQDYERAIFFPGTKLLNVKQMQFNAEPLTNISSRGQDVNEYESYIFEGQLMNHMINKFTLVNQDYFVRRTKIQMDGTDKASVKKYSRYWDGIINGSFLNPNYFADQKILLL